ncbi:MAG: type restriction enzyme protein [Thermoleophilaceae bacterium]|jgi:type I restriction enzyme M protein|nr:type restriction enzyme protein [Thermoleophilaceae bacterium]
MSELRNHANLIWGIAELLRGDYKQAEYGRVILPLVVMRRLDQALEPTKEEVVKRATELEAAGIQNLEPVLVQVADQQFYNRSPLRLHQLLDDPARIAHNLQVYIDGYSQLARAVVDNFRFEREIERLADADLLYRCVARICEVDLHPARVSNLEMGYLFEELIRKFAEQSNETAGEHFTPREVVRLMVRLLLSGDADALSNPGIIRTVFDCACGTGGMLSEAQDEIRQLNPAATVHLFGQELNAESFAICLADMLVKGTDASHIVLGNSLSNDGHRGDTFHYGIANPPFGVDWTKVEREVRDEHERLGEDGRFGPGLPRKSDGQLLFLLHLVAKMRDPEQGGSRVAIVHNGSPLFSGAAGSGESEIRRWIIENDLLEAIVALPEQLFYNTGISSYIWLLTNRKAPERVGRVQLIDARDLWVRMRKSLGEKRREISAEQLDEIVRLHGSLADDDLVKVLPNESFGYRSITIERPLRARWTVAEDSWNGLSTDQALARVDDDVRASIVESLKAIPPQAFDTEAEALTSLRAAISSAGVKPTGSLLRSLLTRCLVRDPTAPPVTNKNGDPVPDPELRDTESVPLTQTVEDYMAREVLPHVPDAWALPNAKFGCEIPFARLFHRYTAPRESGVIREELRELEQEIRDLVNEVLT